MKNKILYLDDEPSNLNVFKATFRREYEVFITDSATEAFEILKNNDIKIIISDQRMPKMNGCEFLKKAAKDYPDVLRMLLTGYSDINVVIEAVNEGKVFKVLNKPWDSEKLITAFEQGIHMYDLSEKYKKLTKDLIKANEQLEFMLHQKKSFE
jgi:DNA-binding NtrC family response regulator